MEMEKGEMEKDEGNDEIVELKFWKQGVMLSQLPVAEREVHFTSPLLRL
jgi:hypothetical protein